jgi:large subunit ribosomal protein L21
MYAIVDIKDKQFKVREGEYVYVPHHADAAIDDTLTFDRVLLLSDGEGDVQLGTPIVEGASVSARVIDQVKGDKVIVFKKKRRKRYRVKKGHRQQYTKVQIEALQSNGKAASEKAASEEDDEPQAEAEPAAEASTEDADAEA